MTLLQIESISKIYGFDRILDDVSFIVGSGEKIGLIGRNGAGKSTLLRIIAGKESADSGAIRLPQGTKIGYLEQHNDFIDGESVQDYLERVTDAPDWQCAKIAAQFQLKNDALRKPVKSLSGGYQMRVKLSALLLREPDLLLLDEPTNYLDLQTQVLLEAWMQFYKGAFMVVSHDREFLKNVCTETLELERGKATKFPQGLELFFAWKDEQLMYTERFNKNVEAQAKHLEQFINRFRYKASKAAAAQSKLKALARLQTIEIAHPLKNVRIAIPQVEHRNTFALRCHKLSIGYGARSIANDINLEILRGEHVAIVGENGQGKSTFLKTAAGMLKPLEGTCTWNNRLKIAYYAQHVHDALPVKETLGRYLESHIGEGVLREDLLRIAGNFLFTQNDFDKPISVLSGGEKARLCLASMLLSRPDILLLDEPTNHLDMETVEALSDALSRWRGTILFVSHSRTFTHQLATSLVEVREGHVRRLLESYNDYVARTRELLVPQSVDSAVDDAKRAKQERFERIQELKRSVRSIEKQLDEYTRKKSALLKHFTAHPLEITPEQSREYNTVETVLAHTEAQWMQLQEELQQLDVMYL